MFAAQNAATWEALRNSRARFVMSNLAGLIAQSARMEGCPAVTAGSKLHGRHEGDCVRYRAIAGDRR